MLTTTGSNNALFQKCSPPTLMNLAFNKSIRESIYIIETGFSVFKCFPDGLLQFHSIKIISVSKDIDIILLASPNETIASNFSAITDKMEYA